MKVEKSECVKLLKELGFSKADEWPDEKVLERISQVPDKVKESEVPKGFEDFCKKLAEAEGIEMNGVHVSSGGAEEAEEEKPKAKRSKGAPTKQADKEIAKAKAKGVKQEEPAKKKPAKKGRLAGLSEMVAELVGRGAKFERVLEAVQKKYEGVPSSWLKRVYEAKAKAKAKSKA